MKPHKKPNHQRSSGRDWLGHRKKVGLCRALAHLRGQDGTGLDAEKEVTWWGGVGTGQDIK